MDITLTLNGRNFASRVDKYAVRKRVETVSSITTLDGVEHVVKRTRDEITFTLIPYNDTTAALDYNALSALQFTAVYTDPNNNRNSTGTVVVASDLESAFGLRSVDGNRYYKGSAITLRAVEAN